VGTSLSLCLLSPLYILFPQNVSVSKDPFQD
jgi:hypothetical protein